MGVPKFYRWLSERYPCLSQVIKEHQIPEFDCLYLDMNGIIHPCSHPNDDDPHFRITEAEIFKNIFNYIEVLFRIIKPKRHFFMAVDGCAPRAKMNQQRSRRFRTAKDAEDNIRKALLKGQTLPKEERFDSNCITPGTEFMAKLQIQLKYFVNHKISTDPLWQKCSVYLSGHDVPGEGEHKIMDFIRYHKAQPGYDPNTRHCLYGLDADLIMLGLTAHEPHFSLLREEVRFGKQAKRLTRPEQQTFHLLHLSLLREYIEMEFSGLRSNLRFRFELERIIDDWILLGFLVGNDFVPHLPHMHINHDALPYLYGVYKEFMPTTDGYLNEGGYINLHRMKKFFGFLSKFDRNRFEEVYADLKWLESKGTGSLLHDDEDGGQTKKKFSELIKLRHENNDSPSPQKLVNPYAALANISGAFEDFSFNESPVKESLVHDQTVVIEENKEVDVEIEDEETFELEFKQHKRHYYMEKFDMDIVDDEQIQTICYEYVRALQWICHYYFNGLQSWSWYYPYHYSPYISDVANFEITELHFDMAQPFRPFEQLLAVLPAASRKLLPAAFQNLMIMDTSPIIDFYPPDFRTDLNGKQQEWEAVVLIPFIDEIRLLKAMLSHYESLTDEEKERNSFGKCFQYSYDKSLNFMYPSSYPGVFEDINVCKGKVTEIDREHFHLEIGQLKKGLMKGTKLDTYFHGFPTMNHIKHTSFLKKAGVRVFQSNSRSHNTIVKILEENKQPMDELAKQLVGETVFVEWPYMVEALVTSICNDSTRYSLGEKNELTSKLVQGDEYKIAKREMKSIETTHYSRRGIELGEVKVLVEAKALLGKRYICGQKATVTLEKEYSLYANNYALQAVVKDLSVHTEQQEVFETIEMLYPAGASVFMLGSPHYGCSGEVIECQAEAARVRVALKVWPEPSFDNIIRQYDRLAVHYISDRAVAQRVCISTQLLGRITGDVHIAMNPNAQRGESYNIGLRLKYSGQNKEVIGYARRAAIGWTYSPATIEILKQYMSEFPEVFEAIGNTRNHELYIFSDLWPKKHKSYLDSIKDFLKTLPCYNVDPVRCGSNSLDEPVVQAVEETVDKVKVEKTDRKIVKARVKPHVLFRPNDQFGKLLPDQDVEFLLFDRVVNVQNGSVVPVGVRGTVIGIHDVLSDDKDQDSPTERKYEVLFDEPFLGALQIRSKGRRCYFMSAHSLINISYGDRKERVKKGEALTTPMKFQSEISQPVTPSKDNGASPFAPKTPGILHTPPHVFKDATFKNGANRDHSTPQQHRSRDESGVSPDYWLKGRYSSPGNYSTPQHQQQKRNYQQKRNTPHSSNDNNDFMSMWHEFQKAEEASKSQSGGQSESLDKNATETLHQMLHISPHNRRQQQKQYSGDNKQRHQSGRYSGDNIRQSPQESPSGRGGAYQKNSLAALRKYCSQMQLPNPHYVYSNSPQGVSTVMMIGQLKFAGNVCANQQQALESAASLSLTHLHQLHGGSASPQSYVFNQSPVSGNYNSPRPALYGYGSNPRHQFSPQQRVLYESPKSLHTAPHQHKQSKGYNAKHSHSDTNFSQQQQQQRREPHQSKSDTSVAQKSPSVNPFIPHQVVVKNKTPNEAPSPSTADNELKGILGIKLKGKDEELKDLLGIGKPQGNPTTQQEQQGDTILKNLLGVTQESSEDIKLKTMLGIGMEESESDKKEEGSVDALVDMLSTFNISSNISKATETTTNTSPQSSSHQHSSVDNVASNEGEKAKPKKQILLAPSFFGPKKK